MRWKTLKLAREDNLGRSVVDGSDRTVIAFVVTDQWGYRAF